MIFKTSLALALLACAVTGQVISTGGCPDLPVKKDFDVKQYLGVWYEIEKYPSSFEYGLKCNTANYTSVNDYVKVVNQGTKSDGTQTSITGKATIPDQNVPAKLLVKFPYTPIAASYWILDTDYKQYSVVYSCKTVFDLMKLEFVWVLSRAPSLESATSDKIYKLLDDVKVDKTKLQKTEQSCH